MSKSDKGFQGLIKDAQAFLQTFTTFLDYEVARTRYRADHGNDRVDADIKTANLAQAKAEADLVEARAKVALVASTESIALAQKLATITDPDEVRLIEEKLRALNLAISRY